MPASIASATVRDCRSTPSIRISPPLGVHHAAEDAHQRRLAGAVLAHQRDDFARCHREIDVVERDHAGIGLADVDQFEKRLWHGWPRRRK